MMQPRPMPRPKLRAGQKVFTREHMEKVASPSTWLGLGVGVGVGVGRGRGRVRGRVGVRGRGRVRVGAVDLDELLHASLRG